MKNIKSNVKRVKVRVKDRTVSDLEVAIILKNLEGIEKSFGRNLYTMDSIDVNSEISQFAGKHQD